MHLQEEQHQSLAIQRKRMEQPLEATIRWYASEELEFMVTIKKFMTKVC